MVQMFKDFLWGKKNGCTIFLMHYFLDKVFIFGDIYLNKLKESTKNVFWLVYITATEELIVKRQPFNFTEACAMPIWCNSKICHRKSAWFKRGIELIGDLLSPSEEMESRGEIVSKWGISCNFLEYEQFKSQIFLQKAVHIYMC